MPMRRFSGGKLVSVEETTTPFSRMRPALGVSKPAMQRSTVVLPQPLGPSRQPIAPRASENDRPRTASWLPRLIGVLQILDLEQGIHADYSNKNNSC